MFLGKIRSRGVSRELEAMGPIIKEATHYECDDLIVIPRPRQDLLIAAYLEFKAQDLFPAFFHQLPKTPEPLEWLNWCMEEKSLTLGAFRRLGPDVKLIGLAKMGVPVLMGGGIAKAEVGMIFFKSKTLQRRRLSIPACQMMIEWVFDRESVDALFGTTPEHNRAALRFMRTLGFGHTQEALPYFATWHEKPCGAYISWMTAPQWRELSPFRASP